MLGIERADDVVSHGPLTLDGFRACNDSEESRLPFSVCSDQRDLVCPLNGNGRILQYLQWPVRLGDILQVNDKTSGLLAEPEAEVDSRRVVNDFLYLIHAFECFNARLHLSCLRRLGFEAFYKPFSLLDLLLLVFIGI